VFTKLTQLINTCLEKNIPFVSFRLPNETAIQTWVQHSGKFNFVEHIQEIADQSGFIYAPFHRRTNFPIVFFRPELVFENDNFNSTVIDEISNKKPLYPDYKYELPVEIVKNEYLNQAKIIINAFDQDFSKAVLSRVQLTDKPQNFNAGEFFIKLQEIYPNAFCHVINIPGTGMWTGASPETLLQIGENSAHTISLAGTQPFQQNEINWSIKEIEEQHIVTDYIENLLYQFSIKIFTKEKVQNYRAGNAVHLASKFIFDRSYVDKNPGEFISALHPTPAVCGYPKEKALDLIFQTEKHNREYYSGFCGPINMNKKTNLFINLRCMKILQDILALYVGGGLTAKSDPQLEWNETLLKAKTLLSIL
jgi:isochorismate synthase